MGGRPVPIGGGRKTCPRGSAPSDSQSATTPSADRDTYGRRCALDAGRLPLVSPAGGCRPMTPGHPAPPTRNGKLLRWVEEVAALTQPDAIHWCDGSQAEYDGMFERMLAAGTAVRLDADTRPNSYLVLSDPADV